MLKTSTLFVIILLCMTSQEALSRSPVDVERLASQQYAELLAKMKEPLLSDYSDNAHAETYRLIFSEAFQDDVPVVVRVEVSGDGSSEVYSKWLANRKKLKSKHYHLSPDQTAKFLHAFEQTGFWERRQEPLELALDGSSWRLEAWKGGRYHLLDEWNPPRGDWMIRVGKQMLSIGHVPIHPRD